MKLIVVLQVNLAWFSITCSDYREREGSKDLSLGYGTFLSNEVKCCKNAPCTSQCGQRSLTDHLSFCLSHLFLCFVACLYFSLMFHLVALFMHFFLKPFCQ